jgi:hypothetical protein
MTRWMIVISAGFWVYVVSGMDKTGIGWMIVLGFHALIWQAHHIEVKVNKLLDHFGVRIREEDFRE